MIFQALGARYTFGGAMKHLFTRGTESDSDKLRQALTDRYGGETTLYRKGRAALAQAMSLATGGSGKVAISGLTCYSVVQAVEAAGCTPVYVDICEDDLQFGAKELLAAVKKHPDIRAVVVQNMLGIPADMAGIEKVARAAELTVIEDLAHSAGAHYTDGREVGTVGDMTILSFGRDKAVDSVNGGALIVRQHQGQAIPPVLVPASSDQWRDRLYPLIAWTTRAFYPLKVGPYVMAAAIKMRLVVRSADGEVDMTEQLPHWQAKLAFRQVVSLTTTAVRRRQKAAAYYDRLHGLVPVGAHQSGAAPIRVPLLVDSRDEVVTYLRAHGVQANDIWYDVPVSPVRLYGRVQYPEADCPVAVRVAARLLNVPTHERISSEAALRIATLVAEAVKS